MKNDLNPSVAIILVNWNGFDYTRTCLVSLSKIDYLNHHILVVDNGSTDGRLPKLKKEFSNVQYLESTSNLGFTGGNNLGINAALKSKFDLILLLNNDTEVEPDFLSNLVHFQQSNPEYGIVQPLILFNQERDIIWSGGGKFQKWLGRSKTIADRLPLDQYSNEDNKDLDWATGCCMLVPAFIFNEVGKLNDSFFAYFEDVDFSLRVVDHGYKIGLAPKSVIYHEAGAASKKQSSEGQLSPTVFYLTARNQLFQLRLHVGFPHYLIAWPYQMIKFMMWITYFCLRLRIRKVKAVIFGLYDGLIKNPRSQKPFLPWKTV